MSYNLDCYCWCWHCSTWLLVILFIHQLCNSKKQLNTMKYIFLAQFTLQWLWVKCYNVTIWVFSFQDTGQKSSCCLGHEILRAKEKEHDRGQKLEMPLKASVQTWHKLWLLTVHCLKIQNKAKFNFRRVEIFTSHSKGRALQVTPKKAGTYNPLTRKETPKENIHMSYHTLWF